MNKLGPIFTFKYQLTLFIVIFDVELSLQLFKYINYLRVFTDQEVNCVYVGTFFPMGFITNTIIIKKSTACIENNCCSSKSTYEAVCEVHVDVNRDVSILNQREF